MKPTIGRIVLYTLSADDAKQINRRRTSGQSIGERIASDKWPIGAQAHIGNPASEGDELPMTVVRVWDEFALSVNGQVLLDGNDVFWATSRAERNGENVNGFWRWPPRE